MKFFQVALIFLAVYITVVLRVSSDRSSARLQAKSDAAKKFDEYGDLIEDDEGGRLDAFGEALAKSGSDRGYILVYGGSVDPPGRARRYALRAKSLLMIHEGLPSDRILTVDGGYRGNLTVELWIVPNGALPPSPSPTETQQQPRDEAWEFDDYTYNYEFSWNSFETPAIRLDGFADWLRAHPGTKGYIVAYALNRDDRQGVQGDRLGTARRFAVGEKRYLTRTRGVNAMRVAAIDGGYSNTRTAVLWVVPAGASPPAVRRVK